MTEARPVSCLFVAYAYPPISAPGAVRITRTLKHLDRTKVDPWVLTVAEGHSVREGGLDDPLACEPERVVRVRDPLGSAAAKMRSNMNSGTARPSLAKRLRGVMGRVASAMLLPDRRILWALRSLRTSRHLHGKGISVVYSTSPSPTNHILGYLMARRLGATWIAEFRDPLSWLTEGSEISWVRRAVMRWIEAWTVKHAKAVPVVSEPFADYFRTRYPGAEIISIPNGADIDNDMIANVLAKRQDLAKRDEIALVHAGSLYDGDRNPKPLIAAAKLARDKYGAPVRVKFAGNDTHIAVQAARELGAEDLIVDLGNLEFKEAQRVLQDASANVVLLNSDQIGKIGLMSKFFDYIAAGAPIIVFGPTDSNLSRIVEQDGAGRAFDLSDIEGAARYIAGIKDAPAPDTPEICAKWSAQRMAKSIEDLVVAHAEPNPRSEQV